MHKRAALQSEALEPVTLPNMAIEAEVEIPAAKRKPPKPSRAKAAE